MSAGANFAAVLADAAPARASRPALVFDGASVSYAELELLGRRGAGMLRARGVGCGDRVALKLANVPAYVAAYLGALRVGAIAVPINARLRPREARLHIADSGARLLVTAGAEATTTRRSLGVETLVVPVTGPEQPPGDEAIVRRAPQDTAVLLYSSGTTGRPKGVELTHGNLAAASAMTAAALCRVLREAVVLAAAPLSHGYGLGCGLNAPLRTGAAIALLERFDADLALDLIERDRTTVFLGVPTMLVRMLAAQAIRPRDLSSLRACLSGGGALRAALLYDCERAFGCEVLEGYGASEVLRVATNRPAQRSAGSVGRPLDGIEARVVDGEGEPVLPGAVGELEVRGPSVMKGYWGQPAATAATMRDGWLRLGDLGRFDADGSLFLVGRSKDIILRGGFSVHPGEIEEVLALHPDVAEAAVVGIPDDEMGEEIAAAVVMAGGDEATDPCRLETWLCDQLAPHKRPRLLWAVEALPRGITGKVLREELRASAAERRAAQAAREPKQTSDSILSASVCPVSSRSVAIRTLR